ncbi:virulence factor SrfB [Glaesserella sp.]|uniref:virulence factor SrfB n=1 Tax=Glaesserella sp. TaxID=2094731 RepID=UPI00359FC47C
MLPDLHQYGKELSLVMNSGIQFIDFALKIDWKDKLWREKNVGNFIHSANKGPLRRLLLSKNGEGYYDPSDDNKMMLKIDHEINVEDSLKLFDGIWLPMPVFRNIAGRYDEGPYNWARARIIKLDEVDSDGNTHRVTFAFDTKIFNSNQNTAYLAPTDEDVRSGTTFAFAHQSNHIAWFLDFKWVNEWLLELFNELAPEPTRLKIHPDDLEQDIRDYIYQGHYLNLLALFGEELNLPVLKIASNKRDDIQKAIPVDLVLDVGNSRTCGILIEDHAQEQDGMKKRYELEIRDLSCPEHCYTEPFESRVEFAQAFFGKEHFSVLSGRRDAFQWPSMTRVGKEAGRLASRRVGNEGSTGLSSPKRYLWDTERYEQGWRFNISYVKTDTEPYATAEPLSGLINEYGEALYRLSDDIEEEFERKMPVFQPHYSRSSLMTFMLSEVLLQALVQINSPAQRSKLEHSRTPRFLRSIILTVPPAMPKPEREIFRGNMYEAIGLVWKGLGWDKTDEDIDIDTQEGRERYWPVLPEVNILWDEATSGQIVYLFNETQNNYAGRPEAFISALSRPDKTDKTKITIATIDIGGGTTDLVINDYHLDYGEHRNSGSNAYIIPTQRFRDGFKVAGDDILLDMIRDVVLTSLSDGIKAAGLKDPEPILSKLIGTQVLKVQDRLLRQQLTLQIFTPIGLRILKAYEEYDAFSGENSLAGATFSSLLSEADAPTESVLNYINQPISKELGCDFNILELPIKVNLAQIHQLFIRGHYDICKIFESLCEIVNSYQCDVLLLTGRPSRLPGVQSYFKSRLPLPVGRILPLHHYKTGSWYPFHKQGRIDDPKTTAAVGAMLCFLSKNSRIPNFYFRSMALKAYSTVKYIGLLNNNNNIQDSDVYYKDVNLDDEDYEFPDHEFEVRGKTRLGFRQLNVERWAASPLYVLSIESPELRERLASEGTVLKISLKTSKKASKYNNEALEIDRVSAENPGGGGKNVRKHEVKLQLNTMLDAGLNDSQYWLDSGSVKR